MALCEHCRAKTGRKLPMDFRAQFHEAHDHLCHDCIALMIRQNEELDDRIIGYVDRGPKLDELLPTRPLRGPSQQRDQDHEWEVRRGNTVP